MTVRPGDKSLVLLLCGEVIWTSNGDRREQSARVLSRGRCLIVCKNWPVGDVACTGGVPRGLG